MSDLHGKSLWPMWPFGPEGRGNMDDLDYNEKLKAEQRMSSATNVSVVPAADASSAVRSDSTAPTTSENRGQRGGRGFHERRRPGDRVGDSTARGIVGNHSRAGQPNVARSGGWRIQMPREHMCFPPVSYPEGVGENSVWECHECGATWMPEGYRVLDDSGNGAGWPMAANRNDIIMGPERWLPGVGPDGPTKNDRVLAIEKQLYDWRPISGYWVKLWRLQLEQMGADWHRLTD